MYPSVAEKLNHRDTEATDRIGDRMSRSPTLQPHRRWGPQLAGSGSNHLFFVLFVSPWCAHFCNRRVYQPSLRRRSLPIPRNCAAALILLLGACSADRHEPARISPSPNTMNPTASSSGWTLLNAGSPATDAPHRTAAPDAPLILQAVPVDSPAPPPAAATAPPTATTNLTCAWTPLFDGTTLTGWANLEDGAFAGHAEVRVTDGAIHLERGELQTGIVSTRDLPADNYEIELDAMRTAGGDFFCGLTFPVGDEPCTLIVGGWHGMVVGLSNVDHMHAAENMTTTSQHFENDRWYNIRLSVTPAAITAWIDSQRMIHLDRPGHTFTVWSQQEPCRPLGFSTWDTSAALRNIRIRRAGCE